MNSNSEIMSTYIHRRQTLLVIAQNILPLGLELNKKYTLQSETRKSNVTECGLDSPFAPNQASCFCSQTLSSWLSAFQKLQLERVLLYVSHSQILENKCGEDEVTHIHDLQHTFILPVQAKWESGYCSQCYFTHRQDYPREDRRQKNILQWKYYRIRRWKDRILMIDSKEFFK